MTDDFQDATVKAVQALYSKNPDARKLFDWTASLQRDAAETSIERFVSVLNISRKAAVDLAKALEDAGCGKFVVGRRGARSRFEWQYSRVSLGQVAAGETEEIEPVSSNPATDEEDVAQSEDASMTIASAKTLLARSLGVQPDQIEITVKA